MSALWMSIELGETQTRLELSEAGGAAQTRSSMRRS
jgi:hypothetical protein